MNACLFFICSLFVIGSLIGAPFQISISAESAILINADSGKILFSKNAYEKNPPASVTKIVTCLMALQKATSLDEVVKCPLECLIKIPKRLKIEHKYQDPPYRLEPDGTSYGIYAGEQLTVKDLLYGLMLSSGNDAGNVLAYHFSDGDIDKYMEEINAYLDSIGCLNTRFYNPHGLHFPNHTTTARDLAILAKEAIKNPEFLKIIQTVSYERPKTNKQPARIIWTKNRLLKKGPFYYPKAFGIKTGYHEKAGYNFVGAAKDDHRTLISVVLHCPNSTEAFKDTIKMFDSAFTEKKLTRLLLNHQESVFITPVKGCKKQLQAILKEDITADYFPSEEEAFLPDLKWGDFTLPIKKGDKVGEIHVKLQNEQILKKGDLFASFDLELPFTKKMMCKIKERPYFLITGCLLLLFSNFLWLFLYKYRKKIRVQAVGIE